ncbi:hypothetical protein LPJ66_000864 [Kickxella alabastrina]|uniref:Uncharacterized protein n=1 Tax=Kickxella alabastrina TaxID=61397 RepID=A0ACC1IUZ1_9FUNG|nr:hypothetical protein LPJ66_000864 [Kickxella alabastrina]
MSGSNTVDAAALDGWLQQYVNVEAIAPTNPLSGFSFNSGVSSMQQQLDSPLFTYSSPSFSCANSTVASGLTPVPVLSSNVPALDQSAVSAIASVVAGSLSEDMLASMFSEENSTTVDVRALTAGSVSSQETISVQQQQPTGAKRQRRMSPSIVTAAVKGDITTGGLLTPATAASASASVSGVAFVGNDNMEAGFPSFNHSNVTAAAAADSQSPQAVALASSPVPSKLPATAPYSSPSLFLSANSNNITGRRLAPSPSPSPSPAAHTTINSSSGSGNRPLAPRQQPDTSSRSGTSTPPGLSVLAKIAQKQAPIKVKTETSPNSSPTLHPTTAGNSGAAPVVETAAQKRQERLIKNRAAALLSRKRKREYMGKLEGDVDELRETNSGLVRRLEEMERMVKELTRERDLLKGTHDNANGSNASQQQSQQQQAKSAEKPGKSDKSDSKASQPSSADSVAAESKKQPSDAMDVDIDGTPSDISSSSSGHAPGTPQLCPSPVILAPRPPASTTPNAQPAPVSALASHTGRSIRPRTSALPSLAAPTPGSAKQRTAGAVLMAMLFSFSLFSLPSLYSSDNQITVGGASGAAALLPVRGLPSVEPPLLIGDSSPFIERVRRSLEALTQQQQDVVAAANQSDVIGDKVRPMTMEESVGLRAWINKHTGAESGSAELSIVRPLRPRMDPTMPEYAMVYCPTIQQVLFGGSGSGSGDMLEVAHMRDIAYNPVSARVVRSKADHSASPSMAVHPTVVVADIVNDVGGGRMDDVDDILDLVATPAGNTLGHVQVRPKMSFYSPIAVGGGSGGAAEGDILAPWEENARLSAKLVDTADSAGTKQQQQQKYLRIDVEVVGSRWVTADKFANGIYP